MGTRASTPEEARYYQLYQDCRFVPIWETLYKKLNLYCDREWSSNATTRYPGFPVPGYQGNIEVGDLLCNV
eukprot:3590602-Rhodomonas_salina.4